MTSEKRNRILLGAGIALTVLVVAVALVFALRGRDGADAEPVLPSRLEDPEYRAALKAREAAQLKVLGAMDAVRRRIAEAEERGAGEEELAALKDELKACAEEFQAERRRAQDVIRERLRREADDINKNTK